MNYNTKIKWCGAARRVAVLLEVPRLEGNSGFVFGRSRRNTDCALSKLKGTILSFRHFFIALQEKCQTV